MSSHVDYRQSLKRIIAVASAAVPCTAFFCAARPLRPKIEMRLACVGRCVSGASVPVHITLVNRSGLPLQLDPLGLGGIMLARFYVGLAGGSRGPNGSIRLNANGRWKIPPVLPGSKAVASDGVLPPGQSEHWLGGYALTNLYDITIPGRYRFAIRSNYGLYLVRRKVWREGRAMAIGLHYFLPGVWSKRSLKPSERVSTGLLSNFTSLVVSAPYHEATAGALVPVEGRVPHFLGAGARALHIELAGPAAPDPGPATVQAFFASNLPRAAMIKLAGDPQTDFAAVQVTGPSMDGEVVLAKLPKPHYVAYISKALAPLTAYGKWLLKHPPKKLPKKTYTLKPGVEYQYAVPINLSCQYDMSLAGTYRVRVELAHPKIWSNWIKVKVPQ